MIIIIGCDIIYILYIQCTMYILKKSISKYGTDFVDVDYRAHA